MNNKNNIELTVTHLMSQGFDGLNLIPLKIIPWS